MMAEKTSGSMWTGRILTGLVIAFLIMDGSMKLVPAQVVIDTTRDLGWPTDAGTLRTLGAILLASTLLYAVPRTSMIGAILLTGYFGGAVATHMRIGSPAFTHTLFGVYLGVLMWLGLYLRNPTLRSLLGSRG